MYHGLTGTVAKRLTPAYVLRVGNTATIEVDVAQSGGYLTTSEGQNTLSVRVWSVARPSRSTR